MTSSQFIMYILKVNNVQEATFLNLEKQNNK